MEPNTGFSYGIEGTEYHYGADGATTITTRYDDRGQPDEALFSDNDHRLLRRVIFTRDSDGRLLTEEVHLVGEIPFPDIEKQLQTVTPEEREATVAAFANLFGPQKVMSSVTYAYDAKGRVLERRMRMGDLGGDRTTFRYDDHDNPIEKTIVDTHREMHADDEGRLQTTKEATNAQTVRLEYEYDPQGNWTEQVVWGRLEPNQNFQRSNVSRREITYYAD
jgi:YD repeat-containing protein